MVHREQSHSRCSTGLPLCTVDASVLCLSHLPLTQGAWETWTRYWDKEGGGTLEDLELIATICLKQLAFTSCLLIVFTNHRNVLALPWRYRQYLEIRCLANSPLGSSQNEMNNSSTSVRLKRQRLLVCTNPVSFLEP